MVARIPIGIGELVVDLKEIAKLVKEIISINLDDKTKHLVKTLVDAVTCAYNNIVDSYVPFKPLRKNDEVFEKEFSDVYGVFDRTYLKSEDAAGLCYRINSSLYDIANSKSYLSKLPKLQERVANFRNAAKAWYLNDTVLVNTLNTFNKQIHDDLSAIESSFRNEPLSESRFKLGLLVSKWDKEFEMLRTLKNEFNNLSINIK
jgi:hypothetical protein